MSPADGDIPPVSEEIHLPGPSAKPAVLALGTTILLLGVTWSWMVVAVGAIIVVQLTVNMPEFEASGQLLLAVVVLAILLLAPSGIIGYVQKLVQAIRGRAGKRGRDER